jgi:hypothetical protein
VLHEVNRFISYLVNVHYDVLSSIFFFLLFLPVRLECIRQFLELDGDGSVAALRSGGPGLKIFQERLQLFLHSFLCDWRS